MEKAQIFCETHLKFLLKTSIMQPCSHAVVPAKFYMLFLKFCKKCMHHQKSKTSLHPRLWLQQKLRSFFNFLEYLFEKF